MSNTLLIRNSIILQFIQFTELIKVLVKYRQFLFQKIMIEALKYKRHLIPSLYSCVFIWDNQTTVDTAKAREPSIDEQKQTKNRKITIYE